MCRLLDCCKVRYTGHSGPPTSPCATYLMWRSIQGLGVGRLLKTAQTGTVDRHYPALDRPWPADPPPARGTSGRCMRRGNDCGRCCKRRMATGPKRGACATCRSDTQRRRLRCRCPRTGLLSAVPCTLRPRQELLSAVPCTPVPWPPLNEPACPPARAPRDDEAPRVRGEG